MRIKLVHLVGVATRKLTKARVHVCNQPLVQCVYRSRKCPIMSGKSNAEMEEFWASLSPKIKSLLWVENRRLILSSDEAPLVMVNPSRIKASPKYYLFEDVFAVVQGNSVTEYHLDSLWLEHMVPSETTANASRTTLTSFRVLYPEGSLELQCKELGHKSQWVTSIADAIGIVLGLQQFISWRGDLNLDTKLELLRSREYMDYKFHSHPIHRDGKYRGQWKDAMPHGSGEYSQESTGMLYKGGFSRGRFHGSAEMLWFSEKDRRKKYIGEFKNGHMNGHGEMKYSDGHIYIGHWRLSQRWGFGRMEETSRRNSLYTGGWEADRRSGYGVYEDKMRHERYLGMWSDGVRCGPGMFVTSTGSYGEAIFSGGNIASGHEGFVIDPNGRSFTGKLGPDLKLCGKGKLVLTNGVTIEGSFGGKWLKKIEINKAVLEDPREQEDNQLSGSSKELQIAKLDRRIGTCTVLASNKWQPIFNQCEVSLGFSGDAANDSYAAWSRLATNSVKKSKNFSKESQRRSNSLDSNMKRTVRVPVELIPLERARTMTTIEGSSATQMKLELSLARSTALNKHLSLSNSALHESPPSSSLTLRHHNMSSSLEILDISHPTHLQKSQSSSPPIHKQLSVPVPARNTSPYAPQTDASPCSSASSDKDRPHSAPEDEVSMQVEEEQVQKSPDTKSEIQKYLDQAFNTERHPLGTLMQRLEIVYRASYGGIGANKYLLPHAIAETHSLIQRIHSIVRILFPMLSGGDQNISQTGLMRTEGFSDPDDYVDIESGYGLLHSLVFTRLFPTLITLYVLHHEESDKCYQRGLDFLKGMDDERVVRFIRFPKHLCERVAGKNAEPGILKAVDGASSSLRVISSLFTPAEFLASFREAFTRLSSIEQLTGDFLLPAIVLTLVRANVPHLGAYLHFLTDFAHTEPADEYTLVTYEAAYNFIRHNAPAAGPL